MARTTKPTISFKVELKKQHTHDTMLVNDKSIEIIDPDILREGEAFIDNPPSRGYIECWMHGITDYIVYPLTVAQLTDHINNNTFSQVDKLGTIKLPSEFACICNVRNKPNPETEPMYYTTINDWSGKIYTRIYDVVLSTKTTKYTISFVTFEGVKTGRKSTSFICWPAKFTNEFLSSIAK